MKQISLVLLLVVLLAACSQQPVPSRELEVQATAWKQLGGDLRAGLSTRIIDFRPVITLSNDKPVVAWQEVIEEGNGEVDINFRVRRWNGTSWQEIGKPSDFKYENRFSLQPSLATQKNGTTIGVSWSTGFEEIFVKTWDGKQWRQVGGMVGEGSETQLAFDGNNRPVVAYQRLLQTGEGTNIYVSRWNGSSWVQLGGPLDKVATNSAFFPSLVIDALGRPVVAWEEADNVNSRQVYVKRWNGTSWTSLGQSLNISFDNVAGTRPSISLLFNFLPVVAWSETSALYVKVWTGWSWTRLGSNLTQYSSDHTLAVDASGRPVLISSNFLSSEPDARRWTCSQFGCAWSLLESTGINSTDMVINSKDQSVIVGLSGIFSETPQLFVKQYSK